MLKNCVLYEKLHADFVRFSIHIFFFLDKRYYCVVTI